MHNHHKKRGSLSLSINAIVVLILAMSMLGLGIAFTKNMFSKFAGQIDVPPPPIDATASEPIVVAGEINFRHGKEFSFGVNFYNDFDDDFVYPMIRCFDDLKADAAIGGIATEEVGGCLKGNADCSVTAPQQKIRAGDQKVFQIKVPASATSTSKLGTDVCEVGFCVGTPWILTNGEPDCVVSDSGGNPLDQSVSSQITMTVT